MVTELRRGRENEKQPSLPRTATSKLRDRGTPSPAPSPKFKMVMALPFINMLLRFGLVWITAS